MAGIPPQSEILKKCCYLDEYNDVILNNDARQAAWMVVMSAIDFAKMCYYDEHNMSYKYSYEETILKYHQKWPSICNFNIFNALPKIDTFMKNKYHWLQEFPHSILHIKELIASPNIFYNVFEVCFGAARVSYPVVQATFSIYFVFEINKLLDPNCECMVRYFLEGSDEILIPYVNDTITMVSVKSILKKKLALFSLIALNSPTVESFHKSNFHKLIENKKKMLNEIRIENNIVSPDNIPCPYDIYQRTKKFCPFHGKNCPVVYEYTRNNREEPHIAYNHEDFTHIKEGQEKLLLDESSSESDVMEPMIKTSLESIGKVSLNNSSHKESKTSTLGSETVQSVDKVSRGLKSTASHGSVARTHATQARTSSMTSFFPNEN